MTGAEGFEATTGADGDALLSLMGVCVTGTGPWADVGVAPELEFKDGIVSGFWLCSLRIPPPEFSQAASTITKKQAG